MRVRLPVVVVLASVSTTLLVSHGSRGLADPAQPFNPPTSRQHSNAQSVSDIAADLRTRTRAALEESSSRLDGSGHVVGHLRSPVPTSVDVGIEAFPRD